MACTGHTPAQLRHEWDLPMVGHMTTYWHNHPPVHVLVAGYMGYKPDTEITAAPDLQKTIAELSEDFGAELPEHLRGALEAFVASG